MIKKGQVLNGSTLNAAFMSKTEANSVIGNIITQGSVTWSGGNSTNANAAYTHITSTGDDHTWINQNVTTTGTPTFASLTLTADLTVANGGTGASTLTGVIKGNGTAAMSAMTSTAGHVTYWSDANTLSGEDFLHVTRGGTGIGAYAIGDILYASTTTALSRLADVAVNNALISGGVGVAPLWGKIGLTTHISGTLAVSNGGTGATTLTGMVKGNAASAMTAVTSTAGYATYWSDANTIAGEVNLSVSRGGTGVGTLTGVVKGNGTGDFSAMTGATGRVTFWSDANTISSDANLFWDNTNKRLGIGNSAPLSEVSIGGVGDVLHKVSIKETGSKIGLCVYSVGTASYAIQSYSVNGCAVQGISDYGTAIIGHSDGTATAGHFESYEGTGLYTYSGTLALDVSGTSRFTGSIGIGTDSPPAKLSINSTSNNTVTCEAIISHPASNFGLVIKRNANDGGGGNLTFLKSRGEATTPAQSGDGIGGLRFLAISSDNAIADVAAITAYTPIVGAAGNCSGEIRFSTKTATGPTIEAMRIDENGDIRLKQKYKIVCNSSEDSLDFIYMG